MPVAKPTKIVAPESLEKKYRVSEYVNLLMGATIVEENKMGLKSTLLSNKSGKILDFYY